MSTDAHKALAFYERALGFEHEATNVGHGPYYVLKQGGVARAGLMQSPEPGVPSFWLPYVSVADCDATVRKAQSLGARVALAPTDIAGVGRFAAIIDPLGATLGVIRGTFTG
jgi:hypothetical protein